MVKETIGTNVTMEIAGDKMVITIDLTQEHGLSTSGKTKVVATTSGSRNIETPHGNVLVGVNVNKK